MQLLRIQLKQLSAILKFKLSGTNGNNINKNKQYDFLKKELNENPEFDKAFPHLQKNKIRTELKNKSQELDFIDSLTDEHRVYEKKSEQEIEIENNKRFLEGYRSPSGPLKYLSQEERQKINILADERLQELEDLNLSKEEILLGEKGKKGLLLCDDPFFQFIKYNYSAREVMIKGGEEYSVKKIIDLALRQDIGLDKAQSNEKYINYVDKQEFIDNFNQDHKDPYNYVEQLDNDKYYGADKQIDVNKFRMIFDQNKKYHLRQMKRGERRKLNKVYLNNYDIDWRNTELLCKFLYPSGQIMSRYLTNLSGIQQRKISKNVKTARQMLLLPYVGNIRPNNRKSLKTLQEDIEDYTRQLINVDNGSLYFKNQENPELNQQKQEEFFKFDSQGLEGDYKEKVSKLKKNMDLEMNFMPAMPNAQQMDLLSAQIYARKLKEVELVNQGINIDKIKEDESTIIDYDNPILETIKNTEVEIDIDNQVLKDSYSKYKPIFQTATNINIATAFISEKALDIQSIQNQHQHNYSFTDDQLQNAEQELLALKKSIGI